VEVKAISIGGSDTQSTYCRRYWVEHSSVR